MSAYQQRKEPPVRLQTYRDQSGSRHIDLVGRGDDPWRVDLVTETFTFLLLGGFASALSFLCIR